MAYNEAGVNLSVSSYNQIKSENTKFNLFIDRMFDETTISDNNQALVIDPIFLDSLIRLCFPERYKKRLSYLRGLNTKIAIKEMKEKEKENGSISNEVQTENMG